MMFKVVVIKIIYYNYFHCNKIIILVINNSVETTFIWFPANCKLTATITWLIHKIIQSRIIY